MPGLWARDPSLVADMRARRANAIYLPDVRFPERLAVTNDLGEALRDTEFIVSAVPSHGTRDILRCAAPFIRSGSIVVSATKGLEQDSLLRMSQILEEELASGVQVAVLSGPSFAAEMARQLPTAVSVASRDLGDRRAGAGGVPGAQLPVVRDRRRRWRGDGRCAEERDRHCRRRGRRAWAGPQRARRAHYARAGGDEPAGLRVGREPRNAGGAHRAWAISC